MSLVTQLYVQNTSMVKKGKQDIIIYLFICSPKLPGPLHCLWLVLSLKGYDLDVNISKTGRENNLGSR